MKCPRLYFCVCVAFLFLYKLFAFYVFLKSSLPANSFDRLFIFVAFLFCYEVLYWQILPIMFVVVV